MYLYADLIHYAVYYRIREFVIPVPIESLRRQLNDFYIPSLRDLSLRDKELYYFFISTDIPSLSGFFANQPRRGRNVGNNKPERVLKPRRGDIIKFKKSYTFSSIFLLR